jgi:hypothetical protein
MRPTTGSAAPPSEHSVGGARHVARLALTAQTGRAAPVDASEPAEDTMSSCLADAAPTGAAAEPPL